MSVGIRHVGLAVFLAVLMGASSGSFLAHAQDEKSRAQQVPVESLLQSANPVKEDKTEDQETDESANPAPDAAEAVEQESTEKAVELPDPNPRRAENKPDKSESTKRRISLPNPNPRREQSDEVAEEASPVRQVSIPVPKPNRKLSDTQSPANDVQSDANLQDESMLVAEYEPAGLQVDFEANGDGIDTRLSAWPRALISRPPLPRRKPRKPVVRESDRQANRLRGRDRQKHLCRALQACRNEFVRCKAKIKHPDQSQDWIDEKEACGAVYKTCVQKDFASGEWFMTRWFYFQELDCK